MTGAPQPVPDGDGTIPLGSHGRAEAVLGTVGVLNRLVSDAETIAANRRWWDADAEDYLAEHGEDLGSADFLWCPEGLRESDTGLLGELAGRAVLDVGCGSAPCARWLATQGARVVGLDLSAGMLRHAVRAACDTGISVPLVQADATRLPFAEGSFDLACSAFGEVDGLGTPPTWSTTAP